MVTEPEGGVEGPVRSALFPQTVTGGLVGATRAAVVEEGLCTPAKIADPMSTAAIAAIPALTLRRGDIK